MRFAHLLSRLSKLFAIATLFVLLLPALALAAEPVNPSIEQLLSEALGIVSTWQAGGWIIGCTAIVNLLVNVMKFKPIADWLEKLKIGWWLRPVIAIVLGIIGGIFSSLVGGASPGTAILVALLAGVSSAGFHELMTALFNKKTQAERAAGAKMLEIVKNVNGVGEAAVASMAAEMNVIAKITDPAAKAAALTAWANANPPAPAKP